MQIGFWIHQGIRSTSGFFLDLVIRIIALQLKEFNILQIEIIQHKNLHNFIIGNSAKHYFFYLSIFSINSSYILYINLLKTEKNGIIVTILESLRVY